MKPYALITRPLPEAAQLADFFATLGYDSLIEPMFTLETIQENVAALTLLPKHSIQAIIFTSRNAILAVKHLPELFSLPVLCVGDTTASFAKEVGFLRVTSAGGDIHDLEDLIKRLCAPQRGTLLYFTGTHVAGELQENLSSVGFTIERHTLYDTKAIPALSTQVQEALRNRQIALALFYSPRTAKIFETLVMDHGLKSYTSTIAMFCLSPAIAGAFNHLKWLTIHYPPSPNTKSLLELVQKFQFNLQS